MSSEPTNIFQADSISPSIFCSSASKEKKKSKQGNTDEERLLRLMLSDMKKKLEFVEKTNWMFPKGNEGFDLDFLEIQEYKNIDSYSGLFSTEPNYR